MKKLILLLASLALAASAAAQSLVTLQGSDFDYEALRDSSIGGAPSLGAGAATADSLRLSANEIGGFFLQESRPILQFNLADLGTLDPDASIVASAILRLTLLETTPDAEFGFQVHGRDTTLGAPILATDSAGPAQFSSSAYSPVGTSVPAPSGPQTFDIDLTPYLNARVADYLLSGDAWVLLRLQPDTTISLGNNLQTTLTFASASHPDPTNHPQMSLVLIPEPRLSALVLSLFVFFFIFIFLRRKARGNP